MSKKPHNDTPIEECLHCALLATIVRWRDAHGARDGITGELAYDPAQETLALAHCLGDLIAGSTFDSDPMETLERTTDLFGIIATFIALEYDRMAGYSGEPAETDLRLMKVASHAKN